MLVCGSATVERMSNTACRGPPKPKPAKSDCSRVTGRRTHGIITGYRPTTSMVQMIDIE